MTSSTIDGERRHIVKLLLFAVASVTIEPRDSIACAISVPPDIHLLDVFPGTIGSYDLNEFAFKVVPRRQTKKNPLGVASLQVGEEWTKRVSISIPKSVEQRLVFPIKASFDDSDLSEGYQCTGLILILESELHVRDPRDRNFSVKAHQVILHAKFTNNTAPYIRTRIKLVSKHSRIGVIASVETPDGEILNIPHDIKVPGPYALCGGDGIYATSLDEVTRLKRTYSW